MRIAISSLAALLVTLALFYVMQSMVKGSGQPIEKPVNYGVVDFVRLQREPAESQTESLPRLPPRQTVEPPRTLPALSSPPASVAPPAAPQPEFAAQPLPPLQLSKPFLDSSTAAVRETPPVSKPTSDQKPDAPDTEMQTSALAPRPANGQMSGTGEPGAADFLTPDQQGWLGGDALEAIPIFKMQPKYPRKAARSRIEGWVKVEFTITEQGTVTDAKVVDAKPRRTFDRSALQSIRKWRFKPKVVDGKAVKRKASQVIEFRLSRGQG